MQGSSDDDTVWSMGVVRHEPILLNTLRLDGVLDGRQLWPAPTEAGADEAHVLPDIDPLMCLEAAGGHVDGLAQPDDDDGDPSDMEDMRDFMETEGVMASHAAAVEAAMKERRSEQSRRKRRRAGHAAY